MLDRGGIDDVLLHRFGTRTAEFGIRLDVRSPGACGRYSFIAATKGRGGYGVRTETCLIDPGDGASPRYYEEEGRVVTRSIRYPPACTSDRLYLMSVSSLPEFRPVYDLLTGIVSYHLQVGPMREWQRRDRRPRLKRDRSNLASVLADLEARAPERKKIVDEYLAVTVPGVVRLRSRIMGSRLTVEFRQAGDGHGRAERFLVSDVSDGTLLDEKGIPPDSILAAGLQQGRTHIGPLDAAMRSLICDRTSTAGQLLRIRCTTPDPRSLGPWRRRSIAHPACEQEVSCLSA